MTMQPQRKKSRSALETDCTEFPRAAIGDSGEDCDFTQDDVPVEPEHCLSFCPRPPVQLVVYFKSLSDHMRSVPKYDETTVLRNLGGFIGMYLGLPFLVIFQVLNVLVVGTLRL
ncbi:hypothetical protein MRX96_049682 [Rhipicephalus microplus]